MKRNLSQLFLFTVALVFVQCSFAHGQIVYKIPDGVFPMDWNKSGFKGTLMLEKDNPSGLFIAFPNQGESLDDLRERSAKFIAPMVVHDTKEKTSIPFEIKSIVSHEGDIADRGRYYFFKGEQSSVQIIFFERKTPAGAVLYGYFAAKGNDAKKSKIWVGDDLKDPKLLSKFIKTFDAK